MDDIFSLFPYLIFAYDEFSRIYVAIQKLIYDIFRLKLLLMIYFKSA